jgi:hypothetical protein
MKCFERRIFRSTLGSKLLQSTRSIPDLSPFDETFDEEELSFRDWRRPYRIGRS